MILEQEVRKVLANHIALGYWAAADDAVSDLAERIERYGQHLLFVAGDDYFLGKPKFVAEAKRGAVAAFVGGGE